MFLRGNLTNGLVCVCVCDVCFSLFLKQCDQIGIWFIPPNICTPSEDYINLLKNYKFRTQYCLVDL